MINEKSILTICGDMSIVVKARAAAQANTRAVANKCDSQHYETVSKI